ncbi:MAG: tetratricopeptide repeat protein [Proteobacteria bacterium]|nr:tetratricopeptide repeat protein [Pseudomonadota bacterium]
MRIIDKEFISDLRRRIEKNPSSILFAKLADLLRQNNDYEEAVRVLKNGLKHHPDYPTAHYILAKCYMELNWLDDAIFELTETLRYDRENISAMELLASLLFQKGNLEKALKIYSELVILNPGKRNEFESIISDIEQQLEEEKQKQEQGKKETGVQEENKGEEENEKIKELDKVIEPHSWEDKKNINRNLSYEGPIAGMSGVRELSLDSLDTEFSEVGQEAENENKKEEKKNEETVEVTNETSKKNVETEEPEQDVPKTFYTTTMAQVYINQKQYEKARKVLNYLESEYPFNEKVKSLIAQLDNLIKEEMRETRSEAEKSSHEEARKEKALKLSELFETLNKNSKREEAVKGEENENKEVEKKEISHQEEPEKKEMNKFKDWLKRL